MNEYDDTTYLLWALVPREADGSLNDKIEENFYNIDTICGMMYYTNVNGYNKLFAIRTVNEEEIEWSKSNMELIIDYSRDIDRNKRQRDAAAWVRSHYG